MRMHMCKKKYDVTFGSRYEAVRTLFHHPGEARDYLARVSTGGMHRQRTSYIRSTLRYASFVVHMSGMYAEHNVHEGVETV